MVTLFGRERLIMSNIAVIAALVAGFFLGISVAYILKITRVKTARELAEEMFAGSEEQRKQERDAFFEYLKVNFGNLSNDALSKTTDQFFTIAKERFESERTVHTKELDSKKELIDQQLQSMTTKLDSVSKLVSDLEKDRVQKFGELSNRLEETGKRTIELIRTTESLREALAHSRTRGQWGERMADDVLRLAGFIENVNYVKQKAVEGSGDRPDFTFWLPRGLKLNMDVKFPYDNYIRLLDAESDSDRETYRKNFLRDVKNRIFEITTRDYIDPEQSTVDYALLFIPNEQIYAYIQEQDSALVDEGLKKRVILCSPFTLFAVLAVIRVAVDNFALEQTSNRILSLLGSFKKQWDNFVKSLEKLGKRIEDAQKEFEYLTTTRRRQLDRPLHEIEELRKHRGLPVESFEEDGQVLLDEGSEDDREVQ
ncbi:DNA recombination protein RmuC [bacterium]|nr:DNA recombination protein RmuC [bacterium]